MAEEFEIWVTASWTRKHYNIQAKTLDARGVRKIQTDGQPDKYNLADAIDKTVDLISKKLNTSDDQKREKHEAEMAKESEKLRKSQLARQLRRNEAVTVSETVGNIGKALRAMTDRLSALPSKVRTGTIGLGQDDLLLIRRTIETKRNAAADHRRTDKHE